jgi:hypothetical protein
MQTVKRMVDAFIKTEPYAVGRELEDEGAKHVYRFTRYTEVPPKIGLRVGDAVHNLRSSLDHLAFALANKGAEAQGNTMSPKVETRVQFPIVSTPDKFKDQIDSGRLKYVDARAVDRIRSLQPFRFGANYANDFLFRVSELDNTDKHRKLAASACVVYIDSDMFPPDLPAPEVTYPPSSWELGAPVVAFVFPTPHPEVDMQFNPPFSVALEDAWPPNSPIHEVLRGYIKYVEQHIVTPLADQFL